MTDDELREQRREDTHNALEDILSCQTTLNSLAIKLNALNMPEGCEQWQFSEITDFQNSLTDLTGRLFAVKSFLENEYFREVDDVASSYTPSDAGPPVKPEDDSLEREREMLAIARNADVRLHEIIVALLVRLGPDRERHIGWRFNLKYFANISNALAEYSSALATFFGSLNDKETEK